MEKFKVIFMGTPDFACPTLARLYFDENIDLCLVVTKEDKKSGRGKEMRESDVKKLTKVLNDISIKTNEDIKKSESEESLNIKNTKMTRRYENYFNYENLLNSINDKKCKKIIENEILTLTSVERQGEMVTKMSNNHQITFLTPHRLKDDREVIQRIKDEKPDFIVVVAYGQILPKEVLEIPKYGCINGHASLLPKYRGASPVQNCILNGENETGTTIMLMNEGLDIGDILMQKKLKIADDETGGSLFDKLAGLTAECVLETIKGYKNIIPTKQDESKATYVKTIKKEDGLISPEKETKEQVLRKIRAYFPWPGTHLICNGSRIKINKAKMIENDEITQKLSKIESLEKVPIFYILDHKLYFRVFDGFLEAIELQMEGRRNMQAKDFINGLK